MKINNSDIFVAQLCQAKVTNEKSGVNCTTFHYIYYTDILVYFKEINAYVPLDYVNKSIKLSKKGLNGEIFIKTDNGSFKSATKSITKIKPLFSYEGETSVSALQKIKKTIYKKEISNEYIEGLVL